MTKSPFDTVWVGDATGFDHCIYNPISGFMCDLACIALIKKFTLMVTPIHQAPGILWTVCRYNGAWHGEHVLLNFAVAECVAHGQLTAMRDAYRTEADRG